MGQFHFTPEGYLELMHAEVPQYERRTTWASGDLAVIAADVAAA
jgi:hypothetical protein